MPEKCAFEYSIVRVVPRVEREEFVNVGVVLFCREQRFLEARIRLDRERLAAFADGIDVETLQEQLDLIPRICAGAEETGMVGQLPLAERFRWLTSPRSTSIQFSTPHSGLSDSPRAALDDLFERLVEKVQA